MIKWQAYFRQTKVDFEACKVLYKEGDYGNAAYHLQQCVEKSVKTLLHHSKTINPAKSHMPLNPVMELQLAFDKMQSIANGHGLSFQRSHLADHQDQYIYQCRQLLYLLGEETSIDDKATRSRDKRLDEKRNAKIALWKNSLGITLDSMDEEFFSKFPSFRSCYRVSLKLFPDINGEPLDIEKFIKRVNRDSELKKLPHYLGVAELGRLLAATLPHEEIGRYPTEIHMAGKEVNSVELYRKHKDGLQELIELVSKTLEIK